MLKFLHRKTVQAVMPPMDETAAKVWDALGSSPKITENSRREMFEAYERAAEKNRHDNDQ